MSLGSFLSGFGFGGGKGRRIQTAQPREQFRPRAPEPLRQGVGFGFGAGSWGAGRNFDPRIHRREMEVIPAPARERPQGGTVDFSGLNNPDMGFIEPGYDSGRAALGAPSRQIEPVMSARAPDPQEDLVPRSPAPVTPPSSSRPAPVGSSATVLNGLGDLDSAPTAGLPHLLPTEDPDLGDPRRGSFATPAPRVDDPFISTVPVSGDIEGVAPDLLASYGNSAEMAYGPGSRVIVGSGLRSGPASASDHNSGEAGDFAVIDPDGVRSTYEDPRIYDMARVAVARGPVQAVGIGEDYMGGDDFHFGTGRGQGRDYIRTWSDWNTGNEYERRLARGESPSQARGSADPGGAGDPGWDFAGELRGIQEGRQIFAERNAPTPVAAAPDRSIRPETRPEMAVAEAAGATSAGGIDWVEVQGPDGSPMWVSRDYLRDAEGNYIRGSIAEAGPYLEQYGARLPASQEELDAIYAAGQSLPFSPSGGGEDGSAGGFAGQYPSPDNVDELIALHNAELAGLEIPGEGLVYGHFKDLLGDGSLYHPDQGLQRAHVANPEYRDYSQGIRLVRTEPPEAAPQGTQVAAGPDQPLEPTASSRTPPSGRQGSELVQPPEQFAEVARETALQYNLDPGLFNALVFLESSWNPQRTSHAGAFGLTQAMPDTATRPGYGVQPMGNRNDPIEQLRFGAEYLSAMIEHYGGDTRRALVAYNWGPGNANRWDGSLDSLPTETRRYVQFVEANMTDGPGRDYRTFRSAPAAGRKITPREPRAPFWVQKMMEATP
jgi:soluble lytic murein transglycosylase-like protein